jgi:ABC-type transport system substrate-binding protein
VSIFTDVQTRKRATGRLTVALAATATALALTACGGSSSGSPAAPSGSTSGAANSAIDFATFAPTEWDPVTSQAGNDVNDLSLVYAALTKLDQQGDAGPGLATSWAWSDKGSTLTLQLRKGVTFSDGTPFNAQAVETNLKRGEDAADSLIAPQLTAIRSVQVVNPYEVALHLSTQDYGLPLVLGGKTGMMVSPKAIASNVKGLETQPVGAGPFTLTSYTPDGQATLVRNPAYYDAAEIHLSRVTLQFIADPQSVLSSLESGQTQLATIQGNQVAAARAAGLKVAVFPSLHVDSIEVNDKVAPFNNRLIDEAINYALDRKALMQTLDGGIGQVDDEPFPPGYVGYSPSVANYYTYDPAKARALVKASGHPPNLTISWEAALGQPEAEQIQAELAAVGLKSDLVALPTASIAELVYVKHSVGFNPNGIVGRESPLQMLNIQYAADGLLNPGRDASPALTAALAKVAKYPLGDPRYTSALQAATTVAVKQSPNVMLFTVPWIVASSPKLSGLPHDIDELGLEGVRIAS